MNASGLKLGLLTDFNSQNLSHLLIKHGREMTVQTHLAPYGQVMQILLSSSGEFWQHPYDTVIVWTFPNAVVRQFNSVIDFRDWSEAELSEEVDKFATLIKKIDGRIKNIFLPTWVLPISGAHQPSIDMRNGVGAANALMRMNLRLADNFEKDSRVVMFNTERWMRSGAHGPYNDKLWYLSKTPFSKLVFEEAAKDMLATLRGIHGLRKKIVLLDLDNTLWGGVVGDVGWEAVRLGGHDPIGEAYLEFQKELKRLLNQGILLALISKNEESVALEAIENNAEMALCRRDFAGWRINWKDKAQNIVELMEELNLGLDSAVFIDDSPVERNRVKVALPELSVPDWPSDPFDYAGALRGLRCFDVPVLSIEDRTRAQMYASEQDRRSLRAVTGSLEDWLEMLDLQITVERLTAGNLQRAAQLMNRTNQMNLSTRRMSAQELAGWVTREENFLWTFRVKDKFGDYGLCGLASLECTGSKAKLADFLLSCRVMGRGVEETMISVVANHARSFGCETIKAVYLPTTKNKPCLSWFEKLGGVAKQGDTFAILTNQFNGAPRHVQITTQ